MNEKKKKDSREKRAILQFLGGEHGRESIKLRQAATIFGREKGDIILHDHEISSTHCQIQYVNQDYHIFDMNSSNGTFVNGKRVLRSKLNSGDAITLGKTEFVFTLEEADQVQHISTIFQGSKENQDKTSIVDTLIESKINHARRWDVFLNVTYKDGPADEFRLAQNIVYLGRATSFGRFEDDVEISRRHLMIKLNDQGEVFIEDQGSTNGSFLNGKRIHGIHLVRPKDKVRIGTCELSIRAIPS